MAGKPKESEGEPRKVIYILDPDRNRAARFAANISTNDFDVTITGDFSFLNAPLLRLHLLVVHDSDQTVMQLLHELAIIRVSIPLCVYSEEIEVTRIVASIRRGALDYFILPTDKTLNERLLLACAEMRDTEVSLDRWHKVRSWIGELSPRELEVGILVADGMDYREIGKALGISARTVEIHARNVYSKLQVRGRVGLVRHGSSLLLLKDRHEVEPGL